MTGSPKATGRPRVLLVEDDTFVVETLRVFLKEWYEVQIARTGEEAVAACQSAAPPALVIMDLMMPDLNGIDATRQIMQRAPQTRVLALSAYADRRMIGEVLKAGACGYLLKDAAFDELADAIRTTATKKVYLSPKIAAELVDDYVRMSKDPAASVFESLSPREREVLQLIAEGQATKQAAACLHVSVKTVETHRRSIMTKLDIHSVAELTKYAIREGLTSVEA